MEQNTIKSTVCARQEIQHVPQLSNMAALSKAMQRNFSDCISCLVNQHQTSDAQQANIAVNSMLLQLQRSHQRCRQKKAPEDLHVSSDISRRGHRKCRGVLPCLPSLSATGSGRRQYVWCFLLFSINTLPPLVHLLLVYRMSCVCATAPL